MPHTHPFDRRRFMRTTGALGAGALLAGCFGDDGDDDPASGDDPNGADASDDADGDSDGQGGHFIMASGDEPETLDPRINTLAWVSNVAFYVFDGLLMREPDGSGYVPHLAADEPEEVDDTTFVFDLREDVTFHNGDELTAEDVEYSFNWTLDPENASANLSDLEFIDEVEASDTHEVTFHLESPFALFEDVLSSMNAPVVPMSVAEELGADDFGREPVGTGPFEFVEWSSASHIHLERFDDYFLHSPALDSLEFRMIPESEVAYVELATGEVHQASVPDTLVEEAEGDDNLEMKYMPAFNYRGLIMNSLREPFDDVRVREAMQYLVDYDEMLEAAVGELGERIIGYMPYDVHELWDFPVDEWEEEFHPPKDHDQALDLLDDAGVGTDFEVDIVSLGDDHWRGLSEVLQFEMEEIGIDASIREVSSGEWLDTLRDTDYDINDYGWNPQPDPDYYFYNMFRDYANDDGGIPDDETGNSSAGYLHEAYRDDDEVTEELQRFDELVRDARREMEQDDRRDLYIEAAEIIQGMYPNIPVYEDVSSTAWRNTVQSYEPTEFGDQELSNHWQNAWIEE
jgi:peptide/nickel transport system substrate-binding protein